MRLAIADIRPDERRAAFGALFTLLGMMAAHSLLETSRDALFLAHFAANRLPFAYMAIAPTRGVAVFAAMNAFSVNGFPAMVHTVTELVTALAPR